MRLLRRRLAEANEGFEGDGGHFVEQGSGARSEVMAVGVSWMIFIYLMDMVGDMSERWPLDVENGRSILEKDNCTGFSGYPFSSFPFYFFIF